MTDLKEEFARILGQTPGQAPGHTAGDNVEDNRPLLLKAARKYFAEEKEHLHKAHLDGAGGAAIVAGYTRLVDALVRTIHSHACENNACADPHVLIALGGYGRRELCLCSDLDITFIHEEGRDEGPQKEPDEDMARLNEYVLHFLWDLGFTVGHSIRSLKESLDLAGRDAAILTSMLESRLLAGDETMFAHFKDGLGDSVKFMGTSRFIRLKQRERTRRMREAGAEVYHSTPNVKLTAGGLRDYHTGVWIALARFGLKSPHELFDADLLTEEQFLKVEKALDFIWRVRNQIFLGGGSPEDTLTLSRQEHIARAFGYRASGGALAVELFMQDYYVHASELHLFLEEMLRIGGLAGSRRKGPAAPRGGKTERGLRVAHRQVYLPAKDAGWLARNPSRILEVIWYSQKHGFTPSEIARRSIRKNLDLINERFREDPLAGDFFMALLSEAHERPGNSRPLHSRVRRDQEHRQIPPFSPASRGRTHAAGAGKYCDDTAPQRAGIERAQKDALRAEVAGNTLAGDTPARPGKDRGGRSH
jgi:[protein-PII] uridylyltransferase